MTGLESVSYSISQLMRRAFNADGLTQVNQVVIVGAGPSGLLLALLLTSLAPPPRITILEQSQTLNRQPRATHYGPAAISVLRRVGIIDEVRRRGYMPTTLCWRTLHGPRLCGFDRRLMHDDADAMTVLGVGDLCALLVEELEKKGVYVTWGQKVIALGGMEDDADEAWAETEDAETGKTTRHTAGFLVGCDGGNSSVRRLMFDGRFPGFTWEEQIVATNVSLSSAPPSALVTKTHKGFRPCTISQMRRLTGKTRTLSLTRRTGSWPQKYRTRTCGESVMGNYPGSRTKSSWLVSP